MGLFKKKPHPTTTELKCPAEWCSFTCNDSVMMKRHTDWKHPELTRTAVNSKKTIEKGEA